MTDIAQALYDKLAATAGVTNLVGTRIYLVEAPQNPTTPYLTYHSVSPVRGYTFDGPDGSVRSRFQFDAYDSTVANAGKLSVIAIANAVRAALAGFRGTVSGVSFKSIQVDGDRDLTEPGTRMARRTFDVMIWHDE